MSKNSTPSDLDAFLETDEAEAHRFARSTLWRLIRHVLKQGKLFWLGVFFMLLSTTGLLLEPRILGATIDEGVVPKDSLRLKQLVLLLLFIEVVRVGASILQTYLFSALGQHVMQDLRLQVFSHLQRQPLEVFNRTPVGKLVTRLTNDVAALAEMFSAGMVSILGNILVLVGILVGLLLLDWRVGLISASVLPFLIYLSVVFSKMLRAAYRDARNKLSALNAYLAESLLGIRVLQLFNREGIRLDRYSRLNQWYSDAQISSVRAYAFFQPMITLFSGLSLALAIVWGGAYVGEGTLKLGVLVAIFSYILQFFQPLREVADKWNIFLSGMASAERLFSLLDWKPELTEAQTRGPARVGREIQGRIEFRNVWFAYDSDRWVLRDFSIQIEPGQKVGVVGHTGAGKSTLISLLMRFYDPQRGEILLDGKNLKEYDLRDLRASLGLVQQDVFTFSGTFAENITLWDGARPELRGMDLSEQFSQHKMSEPVLERGANLSMGERQLLAFARVVHRDPPVWILDEATSNIDSELELKLARLVDTASTRKRTLIAIAHRLSTLRNADLILVLNHGVLVEQGRHEELMKKEGLYSKLSRYQEAFETHLNEVGKSSSGVSQTVF